MHEHVFKYCIVLFNRIERMKNIYCVKPEYGGYRHNDWREKLEMLDEEQAKIEHKLFLYSQE